MEHEPYELLEKALEGLTREEILGYLQFDPAELLYYALEAGLTWSAVESAFETPEEIEVLHQADLRTMGVPGLTVLPIVLEDDSVLCMLEPDTPATQPAVPAEPAERNEVAEVIHE